MTKLTKRNKNVFKLTGFFFSWVALHTKSPPRLLVVKANENKRDLNIFFFFVARKDSTRKKPALLQDKETR